MRNVIINSNFVEQMKECLTSETLQRVETLRNHVVDSPNFLSENYLVLPYDLKGLLALAFASHLISQEIGVVLREDIREKRSKRFSPEDQALLELFLWNCSYMILFLENSTLWHTREFFGNFVIEVNIRLGKLRFRKESNKVIYPKRKRGYHDHGSRVSDSKKLPKFDYTFTEEQNRIEEKRQSHEDTLDFLKGLLE